MEENRKEGVFQKREIVSKEGKNLVNLRQSGESNKGFQKTHDESPEFDQSESFPSEPAVERRNGGEKTRSANVSSGILDKITEYGIYLLIFFMPLFISPLPTEAYEFGKSFLFCFGAVALFLIWTLDSIFIKKRIRFSKSPLTLSFVAFLVVLCASSYYSIDRASSFLGYNGNFYGSFVFYLAMFAFYMVFVSVSATKGSSRVISKSISALILSALVVTVASLPYYFGYNYLPFFGTAFAGFNLVSGYFHVFAIYLLVMLFVILYDLSSCGKGRPKRKILDVLTGLLVLVNIFLIDWPMVYLIIFVLCAVLMIFGGAIKKETFSNRSELMVLAMIIFSSVLFVSSVNLTAVMSGGISVGTSSSVSNMVGDLLGVNIENKDGSLQNGFGVATALDVAESSLADRTMLGSGLGTYYYDFFRYKSADYNNGDNWALWFSKAYNEILEKVSTIGILGILAYLFLIGMALMLFVKNMKTMKHSEFLLVAFLSLIVFQFLFLETTMLRFLLGLFLAFAAAGKFIADEADDAAGKIEADMMTVVVDNKKLSGGAISFAGVIVLLVCSTSLVMGIQMFKAEARYKAAINATDVMALDTESLAEIMTLTPYRGDYASGLSGIYLARAYQTANVVENDQESANKLAAEVNNALFYTKKAVEVAPMNLLYWENYSYVYKSLKALGMEEGNDKALEGYEEAVKLCPNDPILRTEMGSLYLEEYLRDENDGDKRTDIDNAKSQLEKSQEIKADYAATAVALATAYSYEDEKDKSLAQIDMAYRIGGLDVESVIKIAMLFYNQGEKDKAKEALAPVISADAENPDAHYILGTIYKEEKKYKEALDEFKIVAKSSPDDESVTANIKELENLAKGGSTVPTSTDQDDEDDNDDEGDADNEDEDQDDNQ